MVAVMERLFFDCRFSAFIKVPSGSLFSDVYVSRIIVEQLTEELSMVLSTLTEELSMVRSTLTEELSMDLNNLTDEM